MLKLGVKQQGPQSLINTDFKNYSTDSYSNDSTIVQNVIIKIIIMNGSLKFGFLLQLPMRICSKGLNSKLLLSGLVKSRLNVWFLEINNWQVLMLLLELYT